MFRKSTICWAAFLGLSIGATLSAFAEQPPAPVDGIAPNVDFTTTVEVGDGCGECNCEMPGYVCRHGGVCCLCCPCDMVPHYPYYPPLHGHYYFRPYSYAELLAQRDFAPLIGEDPRAPYSNRVFAEVYRVLGDRHGVGAAPPAMANPAN